MNKTTLLLVLFLSGMHTLHAAVKPVAKVVPFDTMAIHKAYSDGEFDIGIQIATKWWTQDTTLQHSDSLYLCKYLSVMLGSDAAKRENSKYFMHKMLTLDSSATVMDLYASDAIYAIFATVKTEFLLHQKKVTQPAAPKVAAKSDTLAPVPSVTTPSAAAPPKAKSKVSERSFGRSKWLWAIGGTALVGAGVGVIALISSGPAKTNKQVILPLPLPN
jgi:hypothetical protein